MTSNNTLEGQFQKFIRERQYLANLSPRTIRYHRARFDSFKYHAVIPEFASLSPADLTNDILSDYVIALTQSGVKPISIDSYIRGLNCFLAWLGQNGQIPSPLRIPRPRFELELPRTLSPTEISALVQLKPGSRTMRRVHAIALVCLDNGCRVNEVLGLRFGDLDLETMTRRVMGKGRHERMIPFSPDLRRVVVRWIESKANNGGGLVFTTRDGLRSR